MCGIAAIYRFDDEPVSQNRIAKMLRPIQHRGPDDQGIHLDGRVGLGHQRLSIIDLSLAGHQPMTNEDGTVWIVFNGEIYNYQELIPDLEARGHQFRSKSDTEVLIHGYEEYGLKVLNRLNGMFAFALWDAKQERLFLARDRVGIKPLYIHLTDTELIVASEIKAILAVTGTPQPNDARVFDYLFYGFQDHTAETMFAGITQLRGGQYLVVEQNRAEIKTYWDLAEQPTLPASADLAEQFRDLFTDSVRLQLRSDVPVGSCLSGGLDSSAIVSVVHQLLKAEEGANPSERQHTFSSCFDDERFDERRYIAKIVEATETQAHYTFLKPTEIMKLASVITWHQDEPFGSTSIFAQWKVFELASKAGMKVMLDGQGADELLAGYHGYFGAYFRELLRQRAWRRFMGEVTAFRKHHPRSTVDAVRSLAILSLPPAIVRWITRRPSISQSQLFESPVLKQHTTDLTIPRRFENVLTNYLAYLFREISLPSLLHYEDRDSMAFSIESRVPFLDHRLVEFIFRLPDNEKISQGTTKSILRRSMRGIVPDVVLDRQDKMGFVTPESVWLRDELGEQMADFFASKDLRIWQYGRQQAVQDLLARHRAGANHSRTLWRWFNLEIWFQRFF